MAQQNLNMNSEDDDSNSSYSGSSSDESEEESWSRFLKRPRKLTKRKNSTGHSSDNSESTSPSKKKRRLSSDCINLCSSTRFNDGRLEQNSSDGEPEECPVCLHKFKTQLIGTPLHCNHYFCLKCIMEWAAVSTTCPLDTLRFNTIAVREQIGGKIIQHVPVEERTFSVKPDIETIFCMICDQSQPEENMLLCSICNRGCHTYCLTPPLSTIPIGNWLCPDCEAQNSDPAERLDNDISNDTDVPATDEPNRRCCIS